MDSTATSGHNATPSTESIPIAVATELATELAAESAAELAAARAEVEAKEAETRASTRVSGTAKVVTPFRWQHEANTGGASAVPYNTLPGHAFSSPSKTMQDPSDPRVTRREPPEARSLNPATL